MRKLRITVAGKTAIMFDRMPKETLLGLATGQKMQMVRDRPLHETAKLKLYTNDEGQVGIPAQMLLSCLNGAGRKVKVGKFQLATATSSEIPGLIQFEEDFFIFPVPETKIAEVRPYNSEGKATDSGDYWIDVDLQLGRNEGGAGVAVGIIRPIIKKGDWRFDVTLEYDNSQIDEKTVLKLFEIGGRSCGLASFRPGCKGKYGQFKVESRVDVTPKEWLEADTQASSPVAAVKPAGKKAKVHESDLPAHERRLPVGEVEVGAGVTEGANGNGELGRRGEITEWSELLSTPATYRDLVCK